MQVCYLVVDEMHADHPDLLKDQYWDNYDFQLPYTAEAWKARDETHVGSALGSR